MADELSRDAVQPTTTEEAKRIIASGDTDAIHMLLDATVQLNAGRLEGSVAASQAARDRNDPLVSLDQVV